MKKFSIDFKLLDNNYVLFTVKNMPKHLLGESRILTDPRTNFNLRSCNTMEIYDTAIYLFGSNDYHPFVKENYINGSKTINIRGLTEEDQYDEYFRKLLSIKKLVNNINEFYFNRQLEFEFSKENWLEFELVKTKGNKKGTSGIRFKILKFLDEMKDNSIFYKSKNGFVFTKGSSTKLSSKIIYLNKEKPETILHFKDENERNEYYKLLKKDLKEAQTEFSVIRRNMPEHYKDFIRKVYKLEG